MGDLNIPLTSLIGRLIYVDIAFLLYNQWSIFKFQT